MNPTEHAVRFLAAAILILLNGCVGIVAGITLAIDFELAKRNGYQSNELIFVKHN